MKKTCLIVHGKTQDDVRLRPGTATPDKHWAYRLLNTYSEFEAKHHRITYPDGIKIHWGDDTDSEISVRITSALWESNEACFAHLMSFIRQNELTYEFPCEMEECNACEGHPSCVANEHDVTASALDAVRCKQCPCAA